MLTIAALVDRKRSFAPRPTRSPALREIDTMPQLSALMTGPALFERRVFQVLVKGRQALGIKTVLAAKNMLIDGGLVLRDGRFVAIEMKYRMNWLKVCQAGWQFERFLASPEGRNRAPRDGIVFFDEFSGDWARAIGGVERGWVHWYTGHSVLAQGGFRLQLIRFNRRRLYPSPS
ncbi:MAG: hypothetical protein WA628_12120 [Terriglobales bacterium]